MGEIVSMNNIGGHEGRVTLFFIGLAFIDVFDVMNVVNID